VATEDGLRDLQRKIDSSPPTFQRGLEVLGLPDLREAGTSRSEEPLAMAAFLTLWLAGLAAAAWVAWAIFGSPPAVAGWLVLMCVVIAVGVFAMAAFWPDRGMELPFDPDARLVARALPPPGTGGRLFVRVRRDGGDTSVSLVYLALRPSPPSRSASSGARWPTSVSVAVRNCWLRTVSRPGARWPASTLTSIAAGRRQPTVRWRWPGDLLAEHDLLGGWVR